jgi:hypothetical protein
MGSHDVFMADIVSVSCKEELIDNEGKIHFENADLLAYAHGEYYKLGERVGRFGFSTDKPKKEKPEAKHAEGKEPFYKKAPRGEQKKRPSQNKDKGKPHGKRRKGVSG